MNATRTAERTEFLADVLSTAVEGGIGDWCVIESWNDADTEGRTKIKIVEWADGDPEVEGVTLPITVDLDDIARGIAVVSRGDTEVHRDYVGRIHAASVENESGDLDVIDADIVVQAAVFGVVVFG